jgi:hypothetical protein
VRFSRALRINSRNSPCREDAPAILLILARFYSRWDFVAPLLVKLGFCRIRFWYPVALGSGISRENRRIFFWNLTGVVCVWETAAPLSYPVARVSSSPPVAGGRLAKFCRDESGSFASSQHVRDGIQYP